MIMYYNEKKKYFMVGKSCKNKKGCIKVDAYIQNIYDTFSRSYHDIIFINEPKKYRCFSNGYFPFYYIKEKEEFYYNKKLKMFVSADYVRKTMLGDYYAYISENISKKNRKPFTDIKHKKGKYYLEGHEQYKYDDINDLIAKFYKKKYPKYLTIGQPIRNIQDNDSFYKYNSNIFLASDFIKKTGVVKNINEAYEIVTCDDGKYYCMHRFWEFSSSVFWMVYKYEKNSKKEK